MIELNFIEGRGFEIVCRKHKFTFGQERLVTDLPEESCGLNQGLMPTELFAASLAGCLGMITAAWLEKYDLPVAGLKLLTDKTMTDTPPRRIGHISVQILLPVKLTPEQGNSLRASLKRCPVSLSIEQPPKIEINLEHISTALSS